LACKTYLSSLIWGLRDLPYYSGKCYLGVKDFQDLKNYQKGHDICWKNPCGLSKSLKVAEKASNAKGVIFEIEMIAARNVSGLTMTPGEDVMALPFSCFKVLNILEKENQPTHITLQEICVPRATRTVFWVDDNPKNNFAYMRSLERQDISVLPCPSTKRALEFLESYRWLFFLNGTHFRLISDMVRVEDTQTNYCAGIDLIEILRKKHQSQHEILIFCNDVEKARENCISKKLNTKGVYVSSSATTLMEFATFKMIAPENGFVNK